MIKKCVDCGNEFDAREDWHTRCSSCQGKQHASGGGGRGGGGGGGFNRLSFPQEVRGGGDDPPKRDFRGSDGPTEFPIADTFLNAQGYPREEIFLDWAERWARAFEREGLTQASMRRLFNMMKQAQMRLRIDKNFDPAKVTLFEFVRLVEYNNRRKGQSGPIVPDLFKRFVDDHLDTVKKNAQEYSGFVEYLTSIMARMKQK